MGDCLLPMARPGPCILPPPPQHSRCSTVRSLAADAIAAARLLLLCTMPCCALLLLPSAAAAVASPGDTADSLLGGTRGSHCAGGRPFWARSMTAVSVRGQ